MHYFWLQSSWWTLSSKNRHDKDHTRFLVFVSDPLKIESCHVTLYLFIFSVWNAHWAIAVSRHKSQGDHDSNPQSQARNAWISKFRGSVTSKRLIQTKSSQSTVLGYVMFSPFIRSNRNFYIVYIQSGQWKVSKLAPLVASCLCRAVNATKVTGKYKLDAAGI